MTHRTFFKADKLEEKKANFKDRKRQSKQYNANRIACLKLDGYKCQDPDCEDFGDPNDKDFRTIDSHHILGKKYDGVEFRITLCRWSHNKIAGNRHKNIQMLKKLRRTKPNDFRWHTALAMLEANIK